ncbi:hypothetical protein JQ615_18355 [Bradyrhizobium jicamae]|uniref:Uncharacterized protein n=1 Tax=Bradyrhizobium jicamae TaxID=280332 RepID=A0ABS5FKP5_9BRAD|nr:hypothetical protein [Bradyrhizobium jicamae]MBR0797353.1 hypothetical protein [Bradyrhizobium jicamae]
MTDNINNHLWHLEARMTVNELITRTVLTMHVASTSQPVALLDRIEAEFNGALGNVQMPGLDDERAETMRKMVRAVFEQNLDAIRARVVQPAMAEAAAVGGARN